MQITAITNIIRTETKTLPFSKPKEAVFNNLIPCVKGKIFEIFCKAVGMISYGKVAPENISIGKYRILAIIPAILVFGAIPPTISPILNMDTITKKYPPRNVTIEPRN